MTSVLPSSLSETKHLVDPALRAAVTRLSPAVRTVAEYHLGYVDADGQATAQVAGKALRPAITLLTARWDGGPAEPAVPGAVAVELVHNFSLLHDDVMDHDVQRRHRPTAWAVFGVGPALLAGDGMLALAVQVLLERPRDNHVRAAALLTRATVDLVGGQGLDLEFERRPSVTVDECLAMSAGKTGALLGCAAEVGAVLGDAPPAVVDGCGAFGRHLGLAFQAVDDLLGIWGEPAVTGKPAWSDLRQRKKTLPVVAALRAGGHAADQLAALLARPELDGDALARGAELIVECGGRERTLNEARRQVDIAFDHLDRLPLAQSTHGELVALARFVTARDL